MLFNNVAVVVEDQAQRTQMILQQILGIAVLNSTTTVNYLRNQGNAAPCPGTKETIL
jgi:hypothetical protein